MYLKKLPLQEGIMGNSGETLLSLGALTVYKPGLLGSLKMQMPEPLPISSHNCSGMGPGLGTSKSSPDESEGQPRVRTTALDGRRR